jgi:hypothetical protein
VGTDLRVAFSGNQQFIPTEDMMGYNLNYIYTHYIYIYTTYLYIMRIYLYEFIIWYIRHMWNKTKKTSYWGRHVMEYRMR